MIPRWSSAVAALLLTAGCGRGIEREARSTSSRAADAKVAAPAPYASSMEGVAPAGAPASIVAEPAGAGDLPLSTAGAPDTLAASMIIRTGQASVEIDSLARGVDAVRRLARDVGGYVANVSMRAGHEQARSATLELRIPSARFDDALAGLRALGKVERVDVSAQDVGEEYVDVSARVDNARRLEQRLVGLLATRTGKLSDVLAVERELARVRETIERYEGRLRYLRAHAAVSTLAITVHEPLPVVGERGSGSVLAEAFRDAWRNFVAFIAGFVSSLGTLVPLALLVTGVAVAVAKGTRRWRGQE